MRLSRRSWLSGGTLAAVAAVALIVVGCGGSAYGSNGNTTPPASGGGGDTSVTIQNFAFTPQTLTVRPGTTVTWTNKDSVPHTVTGTDGLGTTAGKTGMFDSGNLNQGQTFSFTFGKAGTYYYECTIHASSASMHGKIVVSSTAATGGSTSGGSSTSGASHGYGSSGGY